MLGMKAASLDVEGINANLRDVIEYMIQSGEAFCAKYFWTKTQGSDSIGLPRHLSWTG